MRQRVFLVACALMLALPVPQAQTSTANGVDAFVRGNYQRAAEILKPIAEQSFQADPVAEFFLAALYEAGLGVPLDAVRACALYTRASAHRETLFGTQAMAVLRTLHESLGREKYADCELLARIGFDRQFEPVTFMLELGHSIAWDFKGATITYEGKDTRIEEVFTMGPAVFLPLHHTELEAGRLRSMRRHFIEVLLWVPGHDDQTWTLTWNLFEVVRDELVRIAVESTVTVSGQRPPTDPSFDIQKIATIRVNDHGDAEWSVLAGPHPRTELIESDAARQEDRQLARARTIAYAHVDWTRIRDLHRVPELTYADTAGCGNAKMLLFGWSDDRMEAIAVRADKALLRLSTTPRTFDVARPSSGLELALHVYERPVRSLPFCSDVGQELQEDTWHATRGSVTIELSPTGIRARAPFLYRATIRIAGAEFVNASGVRVTQPQTITLTAIVGGGAE